MIYYLLLLCMPLLNCVQSISQKQYNLKHESPNVILFSAITSLIALCFFVLTSGFDLNFDVRLIPYSLAFAVAYSAAWVGTVLAVRYGLMAISSLIVSFSLIFPTGYGILMGEPVTAKTIVGFALLVVAMVLVNLKFNQKGKFSVKWLICVLVAFFGNGTCSVSQSMHKQVLGDGFKHEFMIIALAAAVVLLMGYALLTSKNFKADFKAALPYSAANGVSNALINLLVLTLIGNIPNTILYPTNSALNMVFTFALAFIVYKERFSLPQYVGYGLGVVSIVLLNI